MLRDLPPRSNDPNLLVGTETSDDAGVYRIAEGLALVQTLDFFPPLVDDPFIFGQIAAANSLSDIYAMNAQPITVMNIVGFPDNELPLSILAEILKGAADRVALAGAVTLGGHSVRDAEIKFGLSVTGIVNPAHVLTNATAQLGDLLVLTKPLGTGFVTTANKKGKCNPDVLDRAIASMITLNVHGRDAVRAVAGVHAMTDVTGFGLGGHALEMADGATVTIEIDADALPIIEGSEAYSTPEFHTRGSLANNQYLAERLEINLVDPVRREYLFDPQTSGGLLIAIDPDHVGSLIRELTNRGANAAAMVGRVCERSGDIAVRFK